jgi:hypothetical protein
MNRTLRSCPKSRKWISEISRPGHLAVRISLTDQLRVDALSQRFPSV